MGTLLSFLILGFVLYQLATGKLRGEDPKPAGPKKISKKRKRRGRSRSGGELRSIDKGPMGR